MKYLEARDEQGRLKRASLGHAVPWARSVVVCAINYNTAHPYSTEASDSPEKDRGWISRYAWGQQDYHESVMPRLRQVEAALRKSCGVTDGRTREQEKEEELVTRCYVDTGPIVERVAAKYAGIGWIGKNTCIINQKIGSWLFLGVILTSLDFRTSGSCLPRSACARPLRQLHALHRCLSNRCADCALSA